MHQIFWVDRSMIRVTVGSNMPQNALFAVVLACWRRHNSQQSRNQHLVCFTLFVFLLFSFLSSRYSCNAALGVDLCLS